MKLVVIESPWAGNTEEHAAYAFEAIKDSLGRNEAPFCSHIFYAYLGVLDDDHPSDRARGIEAGLLWGAKADLTAVYADLGISAGMRQGIERAEAEGRLIEYRRIRGAA